MNVLDLILLAFWAVVIASAAKRGFARAGIGPVFFWAGVLAACWLYPLTGYFLGLRIRESRVAEAIGFLIIIALMIVAGVVLTFLAAKWVERWSLGWLDHSLGVVFGAFNGVILLTLIVVGLALWPHRLTLRWLEDSRLAPPLAGVASTALGLVPDEAHERIKEGYEDAARILRLKLKRCPRDPGRSVI